MKREEGDRNTEVNKEKVKKCECVNTEKHIYTYKYGCVFRFVDRLKWPEPRNWREQQKVTGEKETSVSQKEACFRWMF